MLLILPNNPGDVLMAMHLVPTLHDLFPGIRVDYLVDEECRSLVEGAPGLDYVLVLPRKNFVEKFLHNPAEALLALDHFLESASQRNYTHCFNLFQENFGAVLHGLIPARKKCGKIFLPKSSNTFVIPDDWSRYLYSIPAHREANNLHAVDVYHRIAGLQARKCPVIKLPNVPEAEKIRALLPSDGFIALQPGSAWPGKRWPRQKWIELIRTLKGEELVLIGAPQEKKYCRELVAETDSKCRILCGKTSLLQVAEVLRHAGKLVTGDTFAMHMAAAVNCSVLALFGPSNPVETGPYGNSHICLQGEGTEKGNFDFSASEGSGAMARISVEQVVDALRGLWKKNSGILESRWLPTPGKIALYSPDGYSATAETADELFPDLDKCTELYPLLQNIFSLLGDILDSLEKNISPEKIARELDRLEISLKEKSDQNMSFEHYRIRVNSIDSELPLKKQLENRKAAVTNLLEKIERCS